jgi:glutamine synthetase
VVLNTAVAESLKQFADRLEGVENFNDELHALICETIKKHKRIIFNGNGYDDAWIAEAEKRGLLNLRKTPDCLPYFVEQKNIDDKNYHDDSNYSTDYDENLDEGVCENCGVYGQLEEINGQYLCSECIDADSED